MDFKQLFKQWFALFLISSMGLFLELAVIRWLSAEVRLFSYFKNLPLLAAFMGLAIGFSMVREGRNSQPAFAPVFGLFVALVLFFGHLTSSRALAYPSKGDEFLWYIGDFSYWLALALFLSSVLIFFLLTMFIFIPLGQATGKEMARHAPIPAYIVNLIGSLVGIWIFALLSYLQTPPLIWFGVSILGISSYWAYKKESSRPALVIYILILVGLVSFGQGNIWSPYNRLKVIEMILARNSDKTPVQAGFTLQVQQVFYQSAINLSTQFLAQQQGEIPELENVAYSYNQSYGLIQKGAQVLVVGAGMGNDVAAALRNGASQVDAVEIDPAILALGKHLHPEHPYDDPRVMSVIDDARSYFEKNSKKYDAIVFGLLDSHTLLSGLSSIRLDSFVYTVESFEQVRSHLTKNGIVVVTFGADVTWIDERLGRMLANVFGSGNILAYRGGTGTTFVASTVPLHPQNTRFVPWQAHSSIENLPLATDDWPYLYLRTSTIPAAYWQALFLIGVVCLALFRRTFPQALRPNWHFWLLGAAFLLIEFKSITELALLFGTTWFVNVLAISGVLLMAVVANLLVLRLQRVNLYLIYAFLFASLLLSYFFPLAWFVRLSLPVRAAISMLLLSLPLFFAGVIFSESLRRAGETARPLASNLSGSFAGGVLEYGSLLWGIKSLYLIAVVVYIGALLANQIQRD